jgi:hypothetical protein
MVGLRLIGFGWVRKILVWRTEFVEHQKSEVKTFSIGFCRVGLVEEGRGSGECNDDEELQEDSSWGVV